MNIQTKLEETFAANFVAYYKTHVAHVNIVGNNFYSDHKLLQKIYEDLQDNIDTYAEFLRIISSEMPKSLDDIIAISPITDSITTGDREELLTKVRNTLSSLQDMNVELYETAQSAGEIGIENFAQDRVNVLRKFIWMLDSILD
jgi:DNA-binding ferritin-like protein